MLRNQSVGLHVQKRALLQLTHIRHLHHSKLVLLRNASSDSDLAKLALEHACCM